MARVLPSCAMKLTALMSSSTNRANARFGRVVPGRLGSSMGDNIPLSSDWDVFVVSLNT
eukprot:CAMPEP_0201674212 /NCGR_PEP_ID=MMETSP0494-20130426/36531_1 /ASSEMBLY_ACC=CAM_ASM_000839 /TAXON_ID=420259 /ORGANISM="Thalassiosira gravida, Strain GMp14c1" /LENGTH=58 /DNA_ID=CAMNT_0048156297 /DNA_START=215 /DNA_END=391 /DNA_ORIENTATION=-